jgi:hypothetical protein
LGNESGIVGVYELGDLSKEFTKGGFSAIPLGQVVRMSTSPDHHNAT